MNLPGDRNFDDLAARFKRNIYDRLKGRIRLAVLRRDLAEAVPALSGLQVPSSGDVGALRILDAGGGQGQLALELAQLGHNVTVCDISGNMLALARERFQVADQAAEFIHDSIQNHCRETSRRYDLVLCHAVLEWVQEPRELLALLSDVLAPEGFMSLTFYNRDSLVMKNLLRANFGKVLRADYTGYRGSLTPTWPRTTSEVLEWVQGLPVELVSHTGIRCFHDYILDPALRDLKPDEQLTLELTFSREEPFRSLGRYIHLLLHKRD